MSSVSKVVFGNTTVMDITDSTVSASNLKSGETAYAADGTKITGVLVVPEELDDLSDVTITSPANAHEIYYDGSQWINYGAKILLSFDDAFQGATIALTKGQTTITKTAPSTGNSMSLYVSETGEWTISSTIDGNTYETTVTVTAFGLTYEAELISIPPVPQGSTVTPTDDIQTWLACANIRDKSYTTLAEVLADRSTFETLIADSNACDYMARSTTWASNPPLVPTMTSATTPSGTVSAKSRYDSNTEAWKAFDGNTTTYWQSSQFGISALPQWIRYEFTTATPIGLVKLKNTTTNYQIGTFKIQGSNNGTDFTDLTELITNTDTSSGGESKYSVNNQQAYKYVQFSVESGYSTYTYASIAELQYYAKETCVCDNQDAMALIGKYDYCSNALLGNATWASAIANSDYWDSILQPLVPTMTSNTTPSGTCFGSGTYNSDYYMAFNNVITMVSGWASQNDANDKYVGYEFTTSAKVRRITLWTPASANNNEVKTFKVQYYDNTTNTWKDATEVLTYMTATQSASFTKSYTVSTTASSSKWRFLVLTNIANNNLIRICEAQFYGRSTNEVLVPLVPTMTSNTTPSGECSASMIYGNIQPYVAFDNDTSTKWVAGQDTSSVPTTQWIQYHWGSSKIVNAIKWRANTDSPYLPPTQIIVKGSNDGIDFITITTISDITADANEYFVEFENTIAYSYIRLELTTRTYRSSNYAQFSEIQFYQRTVQTNIVHSCANDTIYYMDEGSPVIVATTNSDGDGVLDFSSLDEGVYTFYSSVAKNPNDLTLDFCKRIRVTNTEYGETTEAYLLPDTVNTLYWYGAKNNLESMVTGNGWSRSSYTFNAPTYNTNYVDCYGNGNQVIGGVSSTYKPALMDRMCTMAQGVTAVNSSYGNIKTEPSKAIDGSSATRQTLYDTNTLKFYVNTTPITDNYFTSYTIANRRCNLYGMWYEKFLTATPTFLSAPYDSLYILDGATKIYIANTNGEGKSYEPLLEAGTYTIYSSIAKDPNNLSNPYSKTITVNESTQTIKVMPSNVLYWYGFMGEIETCSGSYSVTYNINNIRIAGDGSTLKLSGICSSNLLSPSKINAIANRYPYNTMSGGFDMQMGLLSSKSVSDGSRSPIIFDSGTTSYKTYDITNQSGYLAIRITSYNEGYIYALWYE